MSEEKELKINCNIVRDLLPVCCDGQASEDSLQVVNKHLEDCNACKKIYEDMTVINEVFPSNMEGEEKKKEIDLLKKVKFRNRMKIVLGVLAGVGVSILLFVVLFIGVIPVKSDDVSVTYEAYVEEDGGTDENGKGKQHYVVFLHFKLKNGKALDCRTNSKTRANKVKLYSQYVIPFDDRGPHPGSYRYGRSSETPFTEEDVIIIQYRDKTVSYNLKEIAEEKGIQ